MEFQIYVFEILHSADIQELYIGDVQAYSLNADWPTSTDGRNFFAGTAGMGMGQICVAVQFSITDKKSVDRCFKSVTVFNAATHMDHITQHNAPCGFRGCNNRPAPFPGRISYSNKATKPGLVFVLYLSML